MGIIDILVNGQSTNPHLNEFGRLVGDATIPYNLKPVQSVIFKNEPEYPGQYLPESLEFRARWFASYSPSQEYFLEHTSIGTWTLAPGESKQVNHTVKQNFSSEKLPDGSSGGTMIQIDRKIFWGDGTSEWVGTFVGWIRYFITGAPPPPCQANAHRDPNGNCVCNPGYHDEGGICVLDTPEECPPGYHRENGVCVPDPPPPSPGSFAGILLALGLGLLLLGGKE